MTVLPGLSYSASLADPAGSNALVGAVAWLQGTLLGTVATTVGVIAVASVGFMMLTGRIDLRRAITVILGCFILFGASTISAGLRSAARAGVGDVVVESAPAPVFNPPPPGRRGTNPNAFDPYAGATTP